MDTETRTTSEEDVARLMVEALNLELSPADIPADEPLFGEGLGLDSIDALELALAISRTYGFELKSEDARNQQAFASLSALTRYIHDRRTK
jgi:acyl carrier protein